MQTTLSAGRVARAPAKETIRIATVVILVTAGDALLYGQKVGISLLAFLALLAIGVLLGNRLLANRHEWTAASLILLSSLIPLVETVGLLSVAFGLLGLAYFTLAVTGNARVSWRQRALRVLTLLSGDLCETTRRLNRWRRSRQVRGFLHLAAPLRGWILPLVLGSVFIALFSLANPLFWRWVKLLDVGGLVTAVEPPRLVFWLVVALFVWALVRVRRFAQPRRRRAVARRAPWTEGLMIGRGPIVRSLALFNVIFALQTILDIVYLWGGADLPEGIGHAANAQRAAYLLIFTALLAACFVLVALRETDETRSSRLTRALISIWIAQNVVLALSAMLRLDLYVEAYSLTRLRLAAFIWMGLVAGGLLLILVRMALAKSNIWLIKANLGLLCLALYAGNLMDANAVVAAYNVAHSREMTGRGMPLDRHYLCELGPSALPSIEAFGSAQAPSRGRGDPSSVLERCSRDLLEALDARSGDWRAWTFRDHRLRVQVAAPRERLGEEANGGMDHTDR